MKNSNVCIIMSTVLFVQTAFGIDYFWSNLLNPLPKHYAADEKVKLLQQNAPERADLEQKLAQVKRQIEVAQILLDCDKNHKNPPQNAVGEVDAFRDSLETQKKAFTYYYPQNLGQQYLIDKEKEITEKIRLAQDQEKKYTDSLKALSDKKISAVNEFAINHPNILKYGIYSTIIAGIVAVVAYQKGWYSKAWHKVKNFFSHKK